MLFPTNPGAARRSWSKVVNGGPDRNDPRIAFLDRTLPPGFQLEMDSTTIVSKIRHYSAVMGNHALQFLPGGGGKNRTLICKNYAKRAQAYCNLLYNQNLSTILPAAAPHFDKAKECFFCVSWWTRNGIAHIRKEKSWWFHAPDCPSSTTPSIINAAPSFQKFQHLMPSQDLQKQLAANVYLQNTITLFAANHKHIMCTNINCYLVCMVYSMVFRQQGRTFVELNI